MAYSKGAERRAVSLRRLILVNDLATTRHRPAAAAQLFRSTTIASRERALEFDRGHGYGQVEDATRRQRREREEKETKYRLGLRS